MHIRDHELRHHGDHVGQPLADLRGNQIVRLHGLVLHAREVDAEDLTRAGSVLSSPVVLIVYVVAARRALSGRLEYEFSEDYLPDLAPDRVEILRIGPRFGTDHEPGDMPRSNRPKSLHLRCELPDDLAR